MHVSADDLSATTDDRAIVSAEAAKRAMCDAGAGVVAMVRGSLACNGATLDVGRKTRTIPTAIRRAMTVRDRGCRFAGCSNVIVDGHHIEHWHSGGATKLENLVSLCREHHRFLHEGGGSVEAAAAGRFVLRDSRGVILKHEPVPARYRTARTPGPPSPKTIRGRSIGTAASMRRLRGPNLSLSKWRLPALGAIV